MFVIDARGKIREADLPGPELDAAVESLLEEAAVRH
jgi:hypothetical protein